MIDGAPNDDLTIEAFGRTFPIADKIAQMPLLKFAKLAQRGAHTEDMEAFAALYDVIGAVFTPESFSEFEQAATDARADINDLFEIVKAAIAKITARPTMSPSDSSAGRPTTTANSTESSSYEARKRALGLVPVTTDELRTVLVG